MRRVLTQPDTNMTGHGAFGGQVAGEGLQYLLPNSLLPSRVLALGSVRKKPSIFFFFYIMEPTEFYTSS